MGITDLNDPDDLDILKDGSGTLGLIANANINGNDELLGVTAFHVVYPKEEELTHSPDTKADVEELKNAAKLYNASGANHCLLHDLECDLQSLPGCKKGYLCSAIYDEEVDVGVVRLHQTEGEQLQFPENFHWLPHLLFREYFLDSLFNCAITKGTIVHVYHNGSRRDSNLRKEGELVSIFASAANLFENQLGVKLKEKDNDEQGQSIYLPSLLDAMNEADKDEIDVDEEDKDDTKEPEYKSGTEQNNLCKSDSDSDSDSLSEDKDEDMDVDEEDKENTKEHEYESGTEQNNLCESDSHSDSDSISFEHEGTDCFTQPGDSGCAYYILLETEDGRVLNLPIAIHRGAFKCVSYGSCLKETVARLKAVGVKIKNFP